MDGGDAVFDLIGKALSDGFGSLNQAYQGAATKAIGQLTQGLPETGLSLQAAGVNLNVDVNLKKSVSEAGHFVADLLNPVEATKTFVEDAIQYGKDMLDPERLKAAYSSPEAFLKAAAQTKADKRRVLGEAVLAVSPALPAGSVGKAATSSAKLANKAARKATKVSDVRGRAKLLRERGAIQGKQVGINTAVRVGKHEVRKLATEFSDPTRAPNNRFTTTAGRQYQEQIEGGLDEWTRNKQTNTQTQSSAPGNPGARGRKLGRS